MPHVVEAFLSLAARDRKDTLETAAARLGRPAFILEKDVWLCWVLQALFAMPAHHPMAFKGGTSLSKVYGVIDRFSEDVDITLDYRAFDGAFDPFAPDVSRSRIERLSRHLSSSVAAYLRDIVGPALAAAAAGITTSGQHTVRVDDDGERVWFAYPSAVENPVGYLKSEVLLEFGGRNTIDPNERHEIVPDVAGSTDGLAYPAAERLSSMQATPTTIIAWTAASGSFLTTTSWPASNPITTPCAPPASSGQTRRHSIR